MFISIIIIIMITIIIMTIYIIRCTPPQVTKASSWDKPECMKSNDEKLNTTSWKELSSCKLALSKAVSLCRHTNT